jgi:sugar lactone lactonase YvrE
MASRRPFVANWIHKPNGIGLSPDGKTIRPGA